MSVPKRTQAKTPHTSEVPDWFKRTVLDYAGAKVAFERISSFGFPEELLWRWFWGLAQAKRGFTTARKRAPRMWYALSALPPHKLRRFPDRVRGLAEEIERLNEAIQSDGVYRAARELLPDVAKGIAGASPDSMRAELHQLDGLPTLLRSYADSVAVIDRVVAYCAPKAPGRVKIFELKLEEAARKLTGKPHFEEISTLLTAAYSAVGCESVDSKALQMRHSRRRSRKK